MHISILITKFVGKYKKNYRELRNFGKEILFLRCYLTFI
uniref:Uncharacterized protein n=1 Tax=Siphoviridae sp. ctOXk3 TaxID=2827861 RepID=A0A8S5SYJ9_9CAUD|nr:MAG TPA: hypothetical protein [Siphoviridae sp. ctOXk3]